MTGEVTAPVKNECHVDDAVLSAAGEQEMARILDLCAVRQLTWSGAARDGTSAPLAA